MKRINKKYLQILLVFGLIITGLIGQAGFSNIEAAGEKTNLSFESSKKNYLQLENDLDYIPKTLEVSIKFDNPNNNRKIIMGNYVAGKNCFSLELTAANQLRYVEFVYDNNKLVSSIDYKINVPELYDKNWHNIAIVRDVINNKILLYIDGTLKDTLVLNGSGTNILKDDVTLESTHYVGTDARKLFYLDADIHEIRLWQIVKTAEEISQNGNTVLTGKETGLTSNWVFDMSVLDTLNTIVVNKVLGKPGCKVAGFDLPKGRTSLEFESGKKNYVEITENLEKAPKTIDFWAKLATNPNKRQLIFSNYIYGSNGMGIEITADNQLRYVEFGYTNKTLTGNLDIRTSGQEICNNEWTHFAIVRDFENSAVKIYKNGIELVNKQITNTGTDRLTENLNFDRQHYIGTDFRSGNSFYLDGKIDTISLWDSSKTEDEVKGLMKTEVVGNEADLLHSWDFDFNSLSMSNPYIKDKKANGIEALTINFDFNVNETGILNGKSVLFAGDSITNAVKDSKKPYYGWSGRIGSANNMDWKNAGISSATISTALANSYPENRIVNQLIDNQEKAYDYVILHGGMNDSIAMTQIGDMTDSFNLEDFDTSTFSGAMDELLCKAKELYPDAIIGYIVNYATPNSTWGGYSNNNKTYFDRAKEICEKWGIPYIDLYDGGVEIEGEHKSYSYDILEVTSGKNMYDNLSTEIHIGSKGYDIISPYIQKWMEEISQYSNVGTDFSKGNIEIEMVNTFEQIPLTFEAWIKMPESATTSRGGIIAGNWFNKYYSDIPVVNFEIGERGVPRLYWLVNGKAYDYKATGVNVCTNQWTHVAISYDQYNKKMVTYINGEKAHEELLETNVAKLNQPLKIGKDSRDVYNFKGEIADLRIWSTTRTAEEIQDNFKKEIENAQGLLGSWKLDKAINEKYLDSSENQNHAQNYWIDADLFANSADGYKSIAVIPDTQNIPTGSYSTLTNWLKDSKDELGIEFAIHVGDIVSDRNNRNQWMAARDSMKVLDNVIPYVFSAGNHDVELTTVDGKYYGLRSTPLMNEYFPYNEVSSKETFGGTYEVGKVDNTYSYFTVNNVKFLVISLEQSPREEVLSWASEVIEENKDKKVIITTHEYMYYDGNLTNRQTPDHLDFVGGSTTGEEMWDLFVKKHENITAVIAGHVGYPDPVVSKKVGENGNTVTQILCDGQFMDTDDAKNGSGNGVGMVMILSFKENSDEIKVNWYSTVKQKFYRENNQYTDTMELITKDEEVEGTNKVTLSIAIDMANAVTQEQLDKIVPAVADEFKAALKNAQTVFDNAKATQEEVDNAFDRLAKVMQMLEFYKGDKIALQEMMDKIANLIANDYTESTWNALQAVLPGVNEVLGNENAMQGEVDEVYTELVKAFVNLRLKPNKDLLKDLIDKAESLQASNYSVASYTSLVETLNAVKTVYEDPEATVEEVTNAQNALTKAIAGLVENNSLVDDNVDSPNIVKSGDNTVNAAKTGDTGSVGIFIGLAVLSIVGLKIFRKENITLNN